MQATTKVTFRTVFPLRQQTGRAFWRQGTYFGSAGSPRTYQFTATTEAPTLNDNMSIVVDRVHQILANDGHVGSGVTFTEVTTEATA